MTLEKAPSDANVPFDFLIWTLDELYFVFDASGTKHRLAQLVLRGECRLETSTVSLNPANYETMGPLPFYTGLVNTWGCQYE